jgi:hypothetical protein
MPPLVLERSVNGDSLTDTFLEYWKGKILSIWSVHLNNCQNYDQPTSPTLKLYTRVFLVAMASIINKDS